MRQERESHNDVGANRPTTSNVMMTKLQVHAFRMALIIDIHSPETRMPIFGKTIQFRLTNLTGAFHNEHSNSTVSQLNCFGKLSRDA